MTSKNNGKQSRFDELFGTDKEHATEGVKFLIDGEDGAKDEVSVTLAHTGGHNFDYNEAVARVSQPYQTLIDQGQLPAEKMRELLVEAFAQTIVRDWAGITLGGKVVPCTQENVKAVFTESPSFFDACQRFARQANNFRAVYVDGAVGNSPSSSSSS